MKSVSRMLLSSLIVIAFTNSVFAGIGYIDWIGKEKPNITHQEWSFLDASNPAYPDKWCFWNPNEEPYNKVQATITGKPTATWEHFNAYDGHSGVWYADSLEMRMHILDSEDTALCSYKDVVVQAIFQGNLEQPTVTAGARAVQTLANNIYDLQDGWKRLEAVWRICPNPSEEWVCLGLEGTGGAIDYVAIDTICVPEPATILLLGLSSVFLRLKRRSG